MPYDINQGGTSFGKKLPYKNASLSTFSTYDLKDHAAWSKGSSYTQATGYQAWDGSSTKSNVEVESYLISPALNTTCESGKVRISFDHTLRYSNNVSGWKDYHRIYMSKDYDGISNNFNEATWTQLNYIPAASSYSDWTLYSSGYINVPAEFVNCDSVYVAFYFYAPASASTTWELENFLIEEGDASENPSGDDPETPAEGAGTKDSPLNVAAAKNAAGKTGYVTGYIVGYIDGTKLEEGAKFEAAAADETELLLADAADCKDATICLPVQLPVGDLRTALNPSKAENIGKKVTLYGSFETYFGTTGMKATSWASMEGKEYGKDPEAPETPAAEAKGDGTQANPYNCSGVIKYINTLGADTNSPNEVYIEGIICDDPNIDTGSYGNATFHISDDGTANNSFYIFRTFDLGNAKFTDANKIKKGDKVIIVGNVVNYKGNTPETVASKSHLYSINGETGSNNPSEPTDTPSGSSEGVTIDNANKMVTLSNPAVEIGTKSVTLDMSNFEKNNGDEMKEISKEGVTIKFDKGTNSNAPKYYDATKGARIYGDNSLTIIGESTIAKVEFACDAPYTSGSDKFDSTGNPTATVAFDGKTVIYSNVGGKQQLRVKTITITYAK